MEHGKMEEGEGAGAGGEDLLNDALDMMNIDGVIGETNPGGVFQTRQRRSHAHGNGLATPPVPSNAGLLPTTPPPKSIFPAWASWRWWVHQTWRGIAQAVFGERDMPFSLAVEKGVDTVQKWLPRRNQKVCPRHYAELVCKGCFFLVVLVFVACVLVWLNGYRGYVHGALGTMTAEEAYHRGIPIHQVTGVVPGMDPTASQRDQLQAHTHFTTAPLQYYEHLPSGCEHTLEDDDTLRIRIGMVMPNDPWYPALPAVVGTMVPRQFLGVMPMGCEDRSTAQKVDVTKFATKGRALLNKVHKICVAGPHIGWNASVVLAKLHDRDTFETSLPLFVVAANPNIDHKGYQKQRVRDADEICMGVEQHPMRERSTSISFMFLDPQTNTHKTFTVSGPTAIALQRCVDVLHANPCAHD